MMMSSAGQKPIVTINLTPLVDVSLVLVVIFMATAPMLLQSGIHVFPGEKKQDNDSASPADNASDTLLVKIAPGGLWINQQKVALGDFVPSLTLQLQHSRKKHVVVAPDGEILHGEVIKIMDLARQSGAQKLVVFNPPEPNKP